jgi:hypothetical protein
MAVNSPGAAASSRGVAADGTASTPQEVDLDNVEKEALAGEGNFLYKVDVGGRPIVFKVYYGSRSQFLYLKKTLGNVVVTGRSSHQPKARYRVEMDVLDTWERHGFRCFPRHPEITLKGLPREGYMAFDYIPGRHFREYFRDDEIPFEERMAMWRRWVPEWHRRHAIAVRDDDARLVHENGDVKHVMLWEDDFVYFDFEMIFTRGRIRMLVGREMLAYMRSVGRFFGEQTYDRMMDELVEHYPDKTLLFGAWEIAWRHPNPVMRFLRAIDRRIKPTNRKRFSKYQVALDLKARLDRAALNKS